MKILGHPLIPYKKLYSIQTVDEINEETSQNILLFEYDHILLNHVTQNKLPFALHIFNETEAVIGNAIGAKILICPPKLALRAQELAEYYLFDAKVAILINSEDDIQKAIELKVDMAILPDAIL